MSALHTCLCFTRPATLSVLLSSVAVVADTGPSFCFYYPASVARHSSCFRDSCSTDHGSFGCCVLPCPSLDGSGHLQRRCRRGGGWLLSFVRRYRSGLLPTLVVFMGMMLQRVSCLAKRRNRVATRKVRWSLGAAGRVTGVFRLV